MIARGGARERVMRRQAEKGDDTLEGWTAADRYEVFYDPPPPYLKKLHFQLNENEKSRELGRR